MKTQLKFFSLVLFVLFFNSVANAQTAAEMVLVATISSSLDPSISLPQGSSFVSNPKYAVQFSTLLPDAAKYTNFQLYIARGFAQRLSDAFIGQLRTNFAATGYFEVSNSSSVVGTETRVRIEFKNDDNGKTLLLFVVKRPDGVYFLVAQKK
jgi:curli biogenesis system outer membrane secretion channel CsgG